MQEWAKKQTGFTIVELLIVVVVIAILAAITIVSYNGITQRARVASLESNLNSYMKRIEVQRVESGGSYPSSLPSDLQDPSVRYEQVSGQSNYCLERTSADLTYFTIGTSMQPQPGVCSGLVAWWPLNGTRDDAYGGYHGFNGVNGGGSSTTGAKGAANTGWSLPGTGGHSIRTPLNFAPNAFTASVWMNPTGASQSFGGLISSGRDCCGTYTGFHLSYNPGNTRIVIILWIDGTRVASTEVSGAQLGSWQLATATYDGQTLRVYHNGVLGGSASYTLGTPQVSATNNIKIGGSGWSDDYTFGGSLDDARLYNRALTASEVELLYKSGAL